MIRSPSLIARLVAGIALTALSLAAAAQGFPSRPITFIWPFQAGSQNGEAMRVMATEAGKFLGQPVITEFRGGAGSRLGVLAMPTATPDGYVIGAALDAILVVTPMASKSFKFEPPKDYAPIAVVAETYSLLAGHPSLSFRDVKGLVAYARANPGTLNYASPGVGGNSHLYFERFQILTGIQLTHIPYKGSAASLPDRLNGRIHIAMGGQDGKPLIDSGKLVAIATTGPVRERLYPDTPTLAETYPGMLFKGWVGIFAPPRTPPDTVAKLNAALNASLKTPQVRKTMEDAFWRVVDNSGPEEFMTRYKADTDTYGPMVRKLGLELE